MELRLSEWTSVLRDRRVLGLWLVVVLLAAVLWRIDARREPWNTWEAPLDPHGFVWASGTVVHLADGTEVGVPGYRPQDSYVVAGDGIFYETADGILFARPGEAAIDTGLDWRSLHASADGRYIAGIDFENGPRGLYGRVAEVVVVDLKEGREVVRSTEAMGSRFDELDDLYEDATPMIEGFVHGALHVQGASGFAIHELPGGAELAEDPADDSGHWEGDPSHDRLIHRDGTVVDLDVPAGPWTYDGIVDEHTALLFSGPEDGERVAVTCDLTRGECAVVEGTRGQVIVLSDSAVPIHLFSTRT